MQTGQQIAKLRTQAGLTQEALAEKLFVSRDLISKWETGKSRPDYKTVLVLARLFSVEPDTLVDRASILSEELASAIPPAYAQGGEPLAAALNAFLRTLNERDRGVFVRRYYYLEDPAEIGEKYGVKADYVRTILMRTRKKLKSYLKEERL